MGKSGAAAPAPDFVGLDATLVLLLMRGPVPIYRLLGCSPRVDTRSGCSASVSLRPDFFISRTLARLPLFNLARPVHAFTALVAFAAYSTALPLSVTIKLRNLHGRVHHLGFSADAPPALDPWWRHPCWHIPSSSNRLPPA